MIRGLYWDTGARADLIRSWGELPKRDGMHIVVVASAKYAFEATLEVTARQILVRSVNGHAIEGTVGWFPR